MKLCNFISRKKLFFYLLLIFCLLPVLQNVYGQINVNTYNIEPFFSEESITVDGFDDDWNNKQANLISFEGTSFDPQNPNKFFGVMSIQNNEQEIKILMDIETSFPIKDQFHSFMFVFDENADDEFIKTSLNVELRILDMSPVEFTTNDLLIVLFIIVEFMMRENNDVLFGVIIGPKSSSGPVTLPPLVSL